MFSWLVLLTIMASIAYFLLFPRTDVVDLKDKPFDDVNAKQLLLVHQAAVDYATQTCGRDGEPLYTYIMQDGPFRQCMDGAQVRFRSNQNNGQRLEARHISHDYFPDLVGNSGWQDLRNSDIRVSIECLNADTGARWPNCDPNDVNLLGAPLAAFVITYLPMGARANNDIQDYRGDAPMLPYMLGKAFDFNYTGKEVEINGYSTYMRLNTYCGFLEDYRSQKRPPEFRRAGANYNRLPFMFRQGNNGQAADAISNTRYQIATLPKNFAGLNANQADYVLCVTPLTSFSGQRLISNVHYDAD